ncbi:Transposable element Tc3 transposase, partial [Caligus rogercresseyi]
ASLAVDINTGFQISPQIKSQGDKSGERAGHSKSQYIIINCIVRIYSVWTMGDVTYLI